MSTVIQMQCMHELVFRVAPPRTGQRIWCHQCKDMRKVIGSHADWRTVCNDCTFNRTTRTPEAMRRNLIRHTTLTGHTLLLWQVGEEQVTYTVGNVLAADGLPILDGYDSPDTLPLDA